MKELKIIGMVIVLLFLAQVAYSDDFWSGLSSTDQIGIIDPTNPTKITEKDIGSLKDETVTLSGTAALKATSDSGNLLHLEWNNVIGDSTSTTPTTLDTIIQVTDPNFNLTDTTNLTVSRLTVPDGTIGYSVSIDSVGLEADYLNTLTDTGYKLQLSGLKIGGVKIEDVNEITGINIGDKNTITISKKGDKNCKIASLGADSKSVDVNGVTVTGAETVEIDNDSGKAVVKKGGNSVTIDTDGTVTKVNDIALTLTGVEVKTAVHFTADGVTVGDLFGLNTTGSGTDTATSISWQGSTFKIGAPTSIAYDKNDGSLTLSYGQDDKDKEGITLTADSIIVNTKYTVVDKDGNPATTESGDPLSGDDSQTITVKDWAAIKSIGIATATDSTDTEVTIKTTDGNIIEYTPVTISNYNGTTFTVDRHESKINGYKIAGAFTIKEDGIYAGDIKLQFEQGNLKLLGKVIDIAEGISIKIGNFGQAGYTLNQDGNEIKLYNDFINIVGEGVNMVIANTDANDSKSFDLIQQNQNTGEWAKVDSLENISILSIKDDGSVTITHPDTSTTVIPPATSPDASSKQPVQNNGQGCSDSRTSPYGAKYGYPPEHIGEGQGCSGMPSDPKAYGGVPQLVKPMATATLNYTVAYLNAQALKDSTDTDAQKQAQEVLTRAEDAAKSAIQAWKDAYESYYKDPDGTYCQAAFKQFMKTQYNEIKRNKKIAAYADYWLQLTTQLEQKIFVSTPPASS